MATIDTLRQGVLHSIYPQLYGDLYDQEQMDERFITLAERHQEYFAAADFSLFSTAGRVELGGNHTDHNLGRVIAAAVNLDTIAAVTPTDNNAVIFNSEGYEPVTVNLDTLEPIAEEQESTAALIRGIAAGFVQRNLEVGGFQATVSSRVLKGSGLSSSASIEVLVATIFNNLYNGDFLSLVELAKIGQFSENIYFGKPSGLMDQLACAHGGIITIDFADDENPEIQEVATSFLEYGYHLVVVDTKGDHANLTTEYAAIPFEMRQVANYFEAEQLREVDPEEFFQQLPLLRSTLHNDRALLRAMHFFEENTRVQEMLAALEGKDITTYLHLVKESGESSFCFLQNLYPPAATQEQGLSLAIALTKRLLGPESVVRVHGGGFAGTIQAYVLESDLHHYITEMERVYGEKAVNIIAIRAMSTACIAP